jgi:hypothetical protein
MGGHGWGHLNLTLGIRLLQPIKLFQTLPVPYLSNEGRKVSSRADELGGARPPLSLEASGRGTDGEPALSLSSSRYAACL